MNRVKQVCGLFAIAACACLASSPAAAQGKDTSGYPSVYRISAYGRSIMGQVYGYAGSRVCRQGCGPAAQQGGYYIYDRSREFANRYGQRLQDVGRRIGQSIRQRGR